MINDNFNFKKILKESIQGREYSKNPIANGDTLIETPLSDALEFDIDDFDLNRASLPDIENHVGSLENMFGLLLTKTVEGKFRTKAQNIWNSFKDKPSGLKLKGLSMLIPAMQKNLKDLNAKAAGEAEKISSGRKASRSTTQPSTEDRVAAARARAAARRGETA